MVAETLRRAMEGFADQQQLTVSIGASVILTPQLLAQVTRRACHALPHAVSGRNQVRVLHQVLRLLTIKIDSK